MTTRLVAIGIVALGMGATALLVGLGAIVWRWVRRR